MYESILSYNHNRIKSMILQQKMKILILRLTNNAESKEVKVLDKRQNVTLLQVKVVISCNTSFPEKVIVLLVIYCKLSLITSLHVTCDGVTKRSSTKT